MSDERLICTEIPDISGMPLPHAAALMREYSMAVFPWDAGGEGKHLGSVLGHGFHSKAVRAQPVDVKQVFEENEFSGVGWSVGRSSCVVFDVDYPEHTPPRLRDAILDLNPPFHRSRAVEVDGIGRGHYVFRAPAGKKIGNGSQWLGSGTWGEVRSWNGGIACAPGRHSAGGKYEWIKVGEIPPLPTAITPPEYKDKAGRATAREVAWMEDTFTREVDGWLDDRVVDFLDRYDGGPRHNNILGAAWRWYEASVTGRCTARDVRLAVEMIFYEVGKDDDSELTRIVSYAAGNVLKALEKGELV